MPWRTALLMLPTLPLQSTWVLHSTAQSGHRLQPSGPPCAPSDDSWRVTNTPSTSPVSGSDCRGRQEGWGKGRHATNGGMPCHVTIAPCRPVSAGKARHTRMPSWWRAWPMPCSGMPAMAWHGLPRHVMPRACHAAAWVHHDVLVQGLPSRNETQHRMRMPGASNRLACLGDGKRRGAGRGSQRLVVLLPQCLLVGGGQALHWQGVIFCWKCANALRGRGQHAALLPGGGQLGARRHHAC